MYVPPAEQLVVIVGAPLLSTIVKFVTVDSPDKRDSVAGVIVTTGAVVSGFTVTVKVAVPSLPAASPAVAVHSTVVVVVTEGAVKVAPEKAPPFVHVVVGPVVTPTLSVAVKVEEPVCPDSSVSVAGLKDTAGAVVSGAGGGGGGTDVLPLDPPPQEAMTAALNIKAVLLSNFFKTTIGSPRLFTETFP